MQTLKLKTVIGRTEMVDFPKLGLFNIPAKIDTGAYSTSLHCHNIYETDNVLHFQLADPANPKYNLKDQRFTEYSQKAIKNSFGEMELRYTIKTSVRIGKKLVNTSINLSNRGLMKYPVLVGRKLLKNNFLVDVGLVNHLSIK
jgi:hypothetical protein